METIIIGFTFATTSGNGVGLVKYVLYARTWKQEAEKNKEYKMGLHSRELFTYEFLVLDVPGAPDLEQPQMMPYGKWYIIVFRSKVINFVRRNL